MEYLNWISDNVVSLVIVASVIGPGIGWFIFELIKVLKK